jgi:hypothetical protein
MKLQLSKKNPSRAIAICERGFAFILESVEFQCSHFQAAFISPNIASILSVDLKANECQFKSFQRRREAISASCLAFEWRRSRLNSANHIGLCNLLDSIGTDEPFDRV